MTLIISALLAMGIYMMMKMTWQHSLRVIAVVAVVIVTVTQKSTRNVHGVLTL